MPAPAPVPEPLTHRYERVFPELTLFPDSASQKRAWRDAQRDLLFSWPMWALMGALLLVALPAMFAARRWLGRAGLLPFGVPVEIMGGIVGGLVGAASGLIGYRLVAVRIRKRLRTRLRELGVAACLGCGYDLRGQVEPRCPECGMLDAKPH